MRKDKGVKIDTHTHTTKIFKDKRHTQRWVTKPGWDWRGRSHRRGNGASGQEPAELGGRFPQTVYVLVKGNQILKDEKKKSMQDVQKL